MTGFRYWPDTESLVILAEGGDPWPTDGLRDSLRRSMTRQQA